MSDTEQSPRLASVQDLGELNKLRQEVRRLARMYQLGETAHSNVEICVRHFVHPNNYHLGKEMQRIAAVEMREYTDSQGMWPACRGELWWSDVLSTKQARPPDQHPAELLVHSANFISQTNCGKFIAGTLHLKGLEGQEIYGKLMVSREDPSAVNCPGCNGA